MQFSFSVKNINELLEEWKQLMDVSTLTPNKTEKIIKYHPKIADGLMQDFTLESGTKLFCQQVIFPKPVVLELANTDSSSPADSSYLKVCFCIAGSARCKGLVANVEQEINIFSKQCGVSLIPEYKGSIEFAAGEKNILFSLSIEPKHFYFLIEEQLEQIPIKLKQVIKGQQKQFLLQIYRMTPEIQMAVQQVLNCPYQGVVKQLYLEGKANELMALTLQQLLMDSQKSNNFPVLGKSDVDRIHQAKEILLTNLNNPPSLMNLARLVGLNDYKLKLGFRQVFGTTAFGYLRECRMLEARQLLETGLNVTEVARTVGYASESSFTNAFRKKFGVTPIVYKSSSH